MIKIGVIGCGHWGPNYVRDFNKLNNSRVTKCCDIKKQNLNRIKELYKDIATTSNYTDILEDKNIDAVVVATPASTHYEIVKKCLEYGKDVLAEKPLTLVPEESLELLELANKKNKILMVGYTFLFNPGIKKLKEFLQNGELGKIYYLNATRTHLGLVREDVNAIWDLAPHDVSIFNYLTDKTPVSVNAVGACHLKKGREDVAFINLIYPENIIANIHVSWADSNKERTIRVVGSKARVVFDDLNNLEMTKLYKKGIGLAEERIGDFGEFQLHQRDGDIISPKIEMAEPLRLMCEHFVSCVLNRKTPFTDGQKDYAVVKTLRAACESIARNNSTSGSL